MCSTKHYEVKVYPISMTLSISLRVTFVESNLQVFIREDPSRRHWDKLFEHLYGASRNFSESRSEKTGGFTKRENLTVQGEFRAFAIPIIGIKQYFIMHDPEEMDENDIEDLSKVIDDEVEICPHCGWRGFFLACDICGGDGVVN